MNLPCTVANNVAQAQRKATMLPIVIVVAVVVGNVVVNDLIEAADYLVDHHFPHFHVYVSIYPENETLINILLVLKRPPVF